MAKYGLDAKSIVKKAKALLDVDASFCHENSNEKGCQQGNPFQSLPAALEWPQWTFTSMSAISWYNSAFSDCEASTKGKRTWAAQG